MITFEQNFKKEFTKMLKDRKAQVDKKFNIKDLPIPTFNLLVKPREDRHLAVLLKIQENYFDKLNNNTVELLGRVQLYKRETLSDGSIRKDKEGNDVKKEIHVPQTSVAILSPINIKLPNIVEKNGVEKKYTPSDGFMYVDFIEKDGKRKYIYIIPKDYVYKLNLNALVITYNKRKSYYEGYRVSLQDGNNLYIYVIPYRLKAYTDVEVLGVKPSIDFNSEIETLLKHWINMKVIFHPDLTLLEEPINGVANMGLERELKPLFADDYVPYESSIKEEAVID